MEGNYSEIDPWIPHRSENKHPKLILNINLPTVPLPKLSTLVGNYGKEASFFTEQI